MKAFRVFVLINIAAVLSTASGASGPCKSIATNYWPDLGFLKTCYMVSTAINSTGFLITSPRDDAVEGFSVWKNEMLEFLPSNLGEKFPNLIVVNVFGCFIKEIRKEDFKGLGKLRVLNVAGNQLEKIADDTFDGIPAVEEIWLDYNKIKNINGRAFASLSKLTLVKLFWNVCINEDFESATRIVEMPRIVEEKCGSKVDDLKVQSE